MDKRLLIRESQTAGVAGVVCAIAAAILWLRFDEAVQVAVGCGSVPGCDGSTGWPSGEVTTSLVLAVVATVLAVAGGSVWLALTLVARAAGDDPPADAPASHPKL